MKQPGRTLVEAVKNSRPVAVQDNTKFINSPIKQSSTKLKIPLLNRNQVIKFTGNQDTPYSQADYDLQEGRLPNYERDLDIQYRTNPKYIVIKDSKFNKRNNEKVNTAMLDDIVKGAVKSKLDPYTALSIAQRETGIGDVGDKEKISWPAGVFYDGYTNSRKVDAMQDNLRQKDEAYSKDNIPEYNSLSVPVSQYNKIKKFSDNNTQYPFQAEMNTIKEKTKNGTFIRGYNYGDPNYGAKVAKEKEIIMAPENTPFRKYVDSVTTVAKKELPKMSNGGDMKKGTLQMKPKSGVFMRKKMEQGGWAKANAWADNNQSGLSTATQLGATAVDAFAPTDAYGVRSNGAAIGSGALSGASTGAALGSAIPVVGTAVGAGVGAIVGGVSGLLGNKAANKKKGLAIDASNKAQLQSMEGGAEARLAGDPSLKYGRMSASYYANGGKLTPPRRTPIIPKVQPSQRPMPNVGVAPARQMSKYAKGGEIEPLSTEDIKINGASHAAGGVKLPQIGVELEGGETVNDGFVFSKKLGFAKPAEKIARALGKAEKRPENPINTATVNALQRKTELLKVQQEVAKKAVGISNDLPTMAEGGPIMKRDTAINTYNPSLLASNGKFMVEKKDGSIGQWGNPIPGARVPIISPVTKPLLSDKAKGLSGNYYPARGQQRGPDVPVQKPSHRFYKFGGKMKMADGGIPPYINPRAKPYTGSQVPYLNVPGIDNNTYSSSTAIPEVTISAPRKVVAVKADPILTGGVPVRTLDTTATAKTGVGDQIVNGFEKAAPFLSNFYNATQKLPLPPVPVLNDEITPNLVDYSASRAEAVRATRGADKIARENLNSGSAVSATKAANLSQQVRAVGQINEAENNTNAGIRGQVASQNAQIKAGNNSLKNNYQNELVARDLKGKQLASANIADIEQKIQGMSRDKKLFDQEDTKLMLTALSDDTGASWRGAEPLFKKHLSEESYNQVKDHFGKITASQESDRVEAKTTGKLQAAYLKQQLLKGATKEDGSLRYILGENAPSVTGKPEKSSSKVYDKNGKVIRTTVKD